MEKEAFSPVLRKGSSIFVRRIWEFGSVPVVSELLFMGKENWGIVTFGCESELIGGQFGNCRVGYIFQSLV